MNLISFLSDQSFDPSLATPDRTGYLVRRAGRAVLTNDKNEVALLWVEKSGVYKLPGGGLEEGEDIHEALIREILEETGCHGSIGDPIGITLEFRDEWKMIQVSTCYKATLINDTGKLKLDQYEVDEGFSVKWVPVGEALELMATHTSAEYDPKFMRLRDMTILKAALTNS